MDEHSSASSLRGTRLGFEVGRRVWAGGKVAGSSSRSISTIRSRFTVQVARHSESAHVLCTEDQIEAFLDGTTNGGATDGGGDDHEHPDEAGPGDTRFGSIEHCRDRVTAN